MVAPAHRAGHHSPPGDEERVYDFFFQAEDGIRDYKVTGVQTCALPIYRLGIRDRIHLTFIEREPQLPRGKHAPAHVLARIDPVRAQNSVRENKRRRAHARRSEERRVGEEGRSRWSPYHLKKKIKEDIAE